MLIDVREYGACQFERESLQLIGRTESLLTTYVSGITGDCREPDRSRVIQILARSFASQRIEGCCRDSSCSASIRFEQFDKSAPSIWASPLAATVPANEVSRTSGRNGPNQSRPLRLLVIPFHVGPTCVVRTSCSFRRLRPSSCPECSRIRDLWAVLAAEIPMILCSHFRAPVSSKMSIK